MRGYIYETRLPATKINKWVKVAVISGHIKDHHAEQDVVLRVTLTRDWYKTIR